MSNKTRYYIRPVANQDNSKLNTFNCPVEKAKVYDGKKLPVKNYSPALIAQRYIDGKWKDHSVCKVWGEVYATEEEAKGARANLLIGKKQLFVRDENGRVLEHTNVKWCADFGFGELVTID